MIIEATFVTGAVLFTFYLGYFLLMYRKSKDNMSFQNSCVKNYTPFVSVVIPTFNEEDTILFKLNNLEKQDYSNIEIVVVDGSSSDKTLEMTKKFVKKSSLKVSLIEEKERRGKASALNEAFKFCFGEIVVMTDSDAIWKEDALRKAVANFVEPKVGAVTGRQVLLNPEQSVATRIEKTYRKVYEILRVGESIMDSTPIFHGEVSCFRRHLVENVAEDSMADDSELAVKIRKKGFRIVYDPNVVFYEHAPPTLRSRLVQKLRRGQGLIQMFWRQRDILFKSRYGKFGTVIFPSEFFMHVISPILLLAFLTLFLCGIILTGNHILIYLAITTAIFLVASALLKIDKLNILLSYLNSQLILFLSLVYHLLRKPQHKWKKVTETRRLWKERRASLDECS